MSRPNSSLGLPFSRDTPELLSDCAYERPLAYHDRQEQTERKYYS